MVLSSHLPGTIPTTGKGGWYLDVSEKKLSDYNFRVAVSTVFAFLSLLSTL